MDAGWAETIVMGIAIWAAIGLAVAIPFVFKGAQVMDPLAAAGSWGFRLAILPASAALWPLVLTRWLGSRVAPEERSPHRRAADRRAGS